MSALVYWGLCPTFSIVQAAFLFCGSDPSSIDRQSEYQVNFQPHGYVPAKTSLLNAVAVGLLPAQTRYIGYEDGPSNEIDIHTTQIARRDLDDFFDGSPVPGHFFGRRNNSDGPEGATSPLPPKLNAAMRAWTAVTSDPRLTWGKSPKHALRAWLSDHAEELGLLKQDGELNKAGIEEICKVANWKPEGGATPTPGPAGSTDISPGPGAGAPCL
jgi:hypothetical protein